MQGRGSCLHAKKETPVTFMQVGVGMGCSVITVSAVPQGEETQVVLGKRMACRGVVWVGACGLAAGTVTSSWQR